MARKRRRRGEPVGVVVLQRDEAWSQRRKVRLRWRGLARLGTPVLVIAALLFGALLNGSTLMQIRTGVPSALTYAIEAIILMFFLIAWAVSEFRLRRLHRVD